VAAPLDDDLDTAIAAEREKYCKTQKEKPTQKRATRVGWEAELIIGKGGEPAALLINAVKALRKAPEWHGVIWLDAFRNQCTLRGRAPWMDTAGADTPWTDRFDALTACWLQEHGIAVSTNIAGCAVATVGAENVFHPVLDYLAGCQWDGEPRLDTWLVDHLGACDAPYCRAVGTRWLIAAIARVTAPGCKADCALILEGPQGILKSTALRTISEPWFTDEIADLGTKDSAMQVAGAWVIELPELDSIARGDVSRIKAFMSRSTDRFRPPYGHHIVEQPRQCVFAGTVNHNEYLRDETGGRRFWPVQCSRIDVAGLAGVRDQLWAEAQHRYNAGAKWWLDSQTLTQAAEIEQGGRYQADAWQPLIEEFVAKAATVSVGDILKEALFLSPEKWGQAEQNRVARCLRALGWKRFQVRSGPHRGNWHYRRQVEPVEPMPSR
jgi:predicted P-loop ATPase